MDYETIEVARRGVGLLITFNRPHALNAITPTLIAEVHQVVREVESDRSVRALVLTGCGRAFCAGADLKESLALKQKHGPLSSVEHFLAPLQRLHKAIRELPLPVIAAVNGICMAGGMETILICDLVIAARGAVFSDAHARYGLLPALGGAQGLVRAVGPFRAKEMMFTAGRYSAEQMQAMGIVMDVVEDERLEARVDELLALLAERSPEGIARMKRMVNDEAEMPWLQASNYELSVATNHLASSANLMEGLRAFNEKRAPAFG